MQKILMLAMFVLVVGFAAHARNVTADMLRTCEMQYMASANNYILRCPKTAAILDARDGDALEQFFGADNSGDVYGGFVDKIPDDDDYVYVNVASDLADTRYENQRCYRFIRSRDVRRDGFYATEICEYDRPDSYL
ncbi:MAG: hypothetical protein K2L95_00445 [Alphaproteobacteria bacterium]|nr:hypothetical protein [Alphaproteobacteria bacterium]MDE6570675.1 hypothetical protein [Alphaproteobacteria bacterium]